MTIVYLTPPYDIQNPNVETEYRIDRAYAGQRDLIIKITGEKEGVEKIVLLNIFTLKFQAIAGYETSWMRFKTEIPPPFIPQRLLPPSEQKAFLPGLIFDRNKPDTLLLATEITLTIEAPDFFKRIDISLLANSLQSEKLNRPIICQNQALVERCAQLIKPTPVKAGLFPIFLPSNRPSADVLQSLSKQFLKYNTEQKLASQAIFSEGRCFDRAAFLSIILSLYGIETIKIYQNWPVLKLLPIKPGYGWQFHCVVMTVDSQDIPWIWDPWHLPKNGLFTLNQWLSYYEKKSKCEQVILGNCQVVNTQTSNFCLEKLDNYKDKPMIKRLIEEAVPNSPEKPISLAKTYSFFTKAKDKQSLEETHPQVVSSDAP